MNNAEKILIGSISAYTLNMFYYANRAIKSLEKKGNLCRPIISIEHEYDRLSKLETYLNEKGINLLNTKREEIATKKEEIKPELDRLQYEFAENTAKMMFTPLGFYTIKGIVCGLGYTLEKIKKKPKINLC